MAEPARCASVIKNGCAASRAPHPTSDRSEFEAHSDSQTLASTPNPVTLTVMRCPSTSSLFGVTVTLGATVVSAGSIWSTGDDAVPERVVVAAPVVVGAAVPVPLRHLRAPTQRARRRRWGARTRRERSCRDAPVARCPSCCHDAHRSWNDARPPEHATVDRVAVRAEGWDLVAPRGLSRSQRQDPKTREDRACLNDRDSTTPAIPPTRNPNGRRFTTLGNRQECRQFWGSRA